MSNTKSSKASLQADLAHAKKGLAHYQRSVDALEAAIALIDGINADAQPTAKKRRAYKKRATKAAATSAKPKKSTGQRQPASKSGLPKTGHDFWMGLLTKEPQFKKDILAAATSKIGKTTPTQLKTLSNRFDVFIAPLVRQKQVKDKGSRLDRQYFLPA